MAEIEVHGSFKNLSPSPDIAFQFQPNGQPWASVSAAHNGTPEAYRAIGKLRFVDAGDGRMIEYWYKGGITQAHLVQRYENLETQVDYIAALEGIKDETEELKNIAAEKAEYMEGVADQIYDQFASKDEIGTYNASTNLATIRNTEGVDVTFTPTTTPSIANGKSLRVEVPGTQSITGTAKDMVVGGSIISRGGIKWDYMSPPDTGYAKSLLNETLIYQKSDEVFRPRAATNGFKIIAKGRGTSGSKLIQPDFTFNTSALTWGSASDVFVFSCEITVRTNNISTITNLLQFFASGGTPGAAGGVQDGSGGAGSPLYVATLNYIVSKTINTTKTSYVHNFINFDPVNEDLSTEILINNPTFTINGNSAAFVGAALYNPNVGDAITSITYLSEQAETLSGSTSKNATTLASANAFTLAEIPKIYTPTAITNGFKIVAKGRGVSGSKLIQPDFCYNTSALSWGGASDTFVFSCKVLIRTNNILNIQQVMGFFMSTGTPGIPGGTQIQMIGVQSPVYYVEFNLTLSKIQNTAKTDFIHNFIYFDPIDEDLFTEIWVYNPSFTINGNAATFVGAALYLPNAGDTMVSKSTLETIVPDYTYVNGILTQANTQANAYTDAQNRLKGKKWNQLGDSITFGHGVGTTNTYAYLIGARNGMTYRSYGISGTLLSGVSNGSGLSMCNPTRYNAMNNDADYVGVWGTTNDITVAVPIGTDTDTTNATVKGALNILCLALIEKYPLAKIFFLTPLNHKTTAQPYADAIISICARWGIPVLDLYRVSGFYPINQVQRDALMYNATPENPATDVQHPNITGHQLLANTVEAFMRRL